MENIKSFLEKSHYGISDDVKYVWSVDKCRQFVKYIQNENYHDCVNVVMFKNPARMNEITVGADHLVTTTLMMMAILNELRYYDNDRECRDICDTFWNLYYSHEAVSHGRTYDVYRLSFRHDDADFYCNICHESLDEICNWKKEYPDSDLIKAYKVFDKWFKSLDEDEQKKTANNFLSYLKQTTVYVTRVKSENDALTLYNNN